jgi:hypothetical protein
MGGIGKGQRPDRREAGRDIDIHIEVTDHRQDKTLGGMNVP